jgi:outer membrane lipoprotein SlyB
MKKQLVLVVAIFLLAGLACAQETTAAKPASMTASLNKSLGLYVFPAKEQKPEQQAKDEQACYSWAVEQSGIDPLTMQATKPDTVAKGPDGSAVKGAAKGALAGAAIGAIAGDAGKGAAIGAAAGGMGGLKGKKQKEAAKQQQAQQTAAATDAAKIDSFKKAYSACLEGKGYTVK